MVCQTAANDRLRLPGWLWQFLCSTEDTMLLFVSLWMVLPTFGFPPNPNAHPTPLLPTHPPPINFIRDITAVDKNHLKNQQSQVDGKI